MTSSNVLRIDLQSLPPLLLQPRRQRLAEARTATAGAITGAEAWRRLTEAGMIPSALAAASDRTFAVLDTSWAPVPPNVEGIEHHPQPATVEAANTLAADADGVLETERLARQLREGMIPWGALPVTSVDWIVLTHQVRFNFEQGPVFNQMLYSLEYALEEAGMDFHGLYSDHPWLPPFVNNAIRAAIAWPIARDQKLEIAGAYGEPRALVGTPFAALAPDNPFELAVAIWARGYVLEHLCFDNSPAIRIFTTVVDAPQNRRRALVDALHESEE